MLSLMGLLSKVYRLVKVSVHRDSRGSQRPFCLKLLVRLGRWVRPAIQIRHSAFIRSLHSLLGSRIYAGDWSSEIGPARVLARS